MQKDIYDKIIGFLQGASWAIVLVGAYFTFKLTISFGLSFSIFLTLFYVIVSLFLVLALDAFSVNKQKLEEAKKQTKLLEKIYSKHTS
jgi:cobalamin biosynthesis protein CobD/CbiB